MVKTTEKLKTDRAEETFSAGLVVVLIILLSMLGAVAMFVGSIIGLMVYTVLFRERLRTRGWPKIVIPLVVTAALATAIAIALSR